MILHLHQPFHTSYAICTEDDDLIRRLQLKFGGYLRRSDEPADVSIEVIGQEDGTFVLHALGEQIPCRHPLQMIDYIMHDSMHYDERILALHGAAVEWQGQAYIFLAPTTTGKTTLASYLIAHGFGYITEDCILIDRADLTVHPCSAPIHLRDGGLEVLRRLGCAPANVVEFDDTTQMRHAFTPENCVTAPLPLNGIFFIERTQDENEAIPLSANERVMQLMHSPITQYPLTGDYLRLLTRLAKTNCMKIRYYDMEYVAEVIRNGI